jgi:ADP-ribose pyrophosphatase
VCIIPYHDGHVFLIQQFRIAVGEVVLEAPAGKIEAGDTPRTRAEAELEEETGFKAASWVDLGFVYSSVGYCSEKIYLFLALDLTFHGQRLEKDERIHTVRIPLERIKEDLRQGRINDAKTCVGLHRLLMHLKENP